jgi:hypothetical protein
MDFEKSFSDLDVINIRLFVFLQSLGFQGSSKFVIVEDGLFFRQWSTAGFKVVFVLASTTIQYVFGAPAIAKVF